MIDMICLGKRDSFIMFATVTLLLVLTRHRLMRSSSKLLRSIKKKLSRRETNDK